MLKTFKIKDEYKLKFVNLYEPLWEQLCYIYNIGLQKENNDISKEELKPINLDITIIQHSFEENYVIATIDNRVILRDRIEAGGCDTFDDYSKFFEEIIE